MGEITEPISKKTPADRQSQGAKCAQKRWCIPRIVDPLTIIAHDSGQLGCLCASGNWLANPLPGFESLVSRDRGSAKGAHYIFAIGIWAKGK